MCPGELFFRALFASNLTSLKNEHTSYFILGLKILLFHDFRGPKQINPGEKSVIGSETMRKICWRLLMGLHELQNYVCSSVRETKHQREAHSASISWEHFTLRALSSFAAAVFVVSWICACNAHAASIVSQGSSDEWVAGGWVRFAWRGAAPSGSAPSTGAGPGAGPRGHLSLGRRAPGREREERSARRCRRVLRRLSAMPDVVGRLLFSLFHPWTARCWLDLSAAFFGLDSLLFSCAFSVCPVDAAQCPPQPSSPRRRAPDRPHRTTRLRFSSDSDNRWAWPKVVLLCDAIQPCRRHFWHSAHVSTIIRSSLYVNVHFLSGWPPLADHF